jgi:hypothetical protein
MPRFCERHWASVSRESPVRFATASGFNKSFTLAFATGVPWELRVGSEFRRLVWNHHLVPGLLRFPIGSIAQIAKQDAQCNDCHTD